jgi:uroporphyrinogen-III synthase
MSTPVVLNTRAQDQAAELSSLLREAGFDVVEAPAIAIVPAWDPAELGRIRDMLRGAEFDCIVLPSANAGRELVSELRHVQDRVICGTGTARALGLDSVAVALPRFSAAAALDALRATPGARVLLPRAVEGRDELLDGLQALGARVTAPVAYRTVPVADAATRLRAGGVDVLTLCSPSAVRSVAPAVAPQTLLACLGETTASAAREAGLHVAATARRTSMASLVDAVREALGARV